jgi:HK97 family phage prohead protease
MFQKCLSLASCEIKLEGDSPRFVGYASRFNGVDNYGDTIMPGAYEKTLRDFGPPKMFVQHNSRGLPIGKWIHLSEDGAGLRVEGEFTPGMASADEARAALKHGSVDGLSIGYLLKKEDYEEKGSGRIIRSVSKLVEISIVTFPADSGARVDLSSVKSADIDQIETLRDYETFLRDAGGLSKGLAEALANRVKIILMRGEPAEECTKAIEELGQAMRKIEDKIRAKTEAF